MARDERIRRLRMQAIVEDIERRAVDNVMRQGEQEVYDMYHPGWREELDAFMADRGLTKAEIPAENHAENRIVTPDSRPT